MLGIDGVLGPVPACHDASALLMSAVDQGARVLIVDVSATVVCDYAAGFSIMKACSCAIEAGPEARLVIANELQRQLLRMSGLGHLAHVYSSFADVIADQAAAAASALPAAVRPA